MKNTKLIAGILGILTLAAYGVTEDRYTSNCVNFIHNCTHKWASNLGMCWNNGGNGVSQCPTQTETACTSTNTFYEVNNFYQKIDNLDPTTTCTTGGSGGQTNTIWASHTDVTSPAGHCYRTVHCIWITQNPAHCEQELNTEGPWVDLPQNITTTNTPGCAFP